MTGPVSREFVGVVESLFEEEERVGVAFTTFAALYFVDRSHPNFDSWLKLLKESRTSQEPVRFSYDVAGQKIVSLEP